MTEAEFNDLVDDTLYAIEEAADEAATDIDCEWSGGVLTLTFENGSAMIFSRQSAMQELWLAAKSGGFHFHREDGLWLCTKSAETLNEVVATCSEGQGGEALEWD